MRECGAERLVYGSGVLWNYMESALLMLRSADVTDEEKELVAAGNIRRILGIGVPGGEAPG